MDIRAKAMEILQKEDRLQQIVKLIGPDALPDNQRIILQVADMIKNGFLQQSAFDDIDMYSVPRKQVQILRLIVEYYERAEKLILQGATLTIIRALSCTETLVRLKSTVPNDRLDDMKAAADALNREFDELTRRYTK